MSKSNDKQGSAGHRPTSLGSLDELRRRQIREARQRAYWAGRNHAMRHSTRKAA